MASIDWSQLYYRASMEGPVRTWQGQKGIFGVALPYLRRSWEVHTTYDFRNDQYYFRAIYYLPPKTSVSVPAGDTGWCETPEALAAALALIDPTLED